MSSMMAANMMLGQTVKVSFPPELGQVRDHQDFRGKILALGYGDDGVFQLLMFTDPDRDGHQFLRPVKIVPGVVVQTVDTPDISIAQNAGLQLPPGGMPPQQGGRRG